MQSGRLVRPLPDEQKPQPSLLHGLPHPAQCETQSEVSHIRSDIIAHQAPFSRQDYDDSDSDTGDNLMTMLLKPSYTAQVRNDEIHKMVQIFTMKTLFRIAQSQMDQTRYLTRKVK